MPTFATGTLLQACCCASLPQQQGATHAAQRERRPGGGGAGGAHLARSASATMRRGMERTASAWVPMGRREFTSFSRA
jgi:hypothetical protein